MAIFSQALIYGWVSKYRDTIPYTILKIILINKKKNDKYFINIFILLVDKDNEKQFIFIVGLRNSHQPVFVFYKTGFNESIVNSILSEDEKKLKSFLIQARAY